VNTLYLSFAPQRQRPSQDRERNRPGGRSLHIARRGSIDQTIPQRPAAATPADALLNRMDLWWRAANYLSVGQVYLLLDEKPTTHKHVKKRLPGHLGTTPGLNFT
jgi:hypothetical protein